ncbi:MAG: M1 family metallopeptidase [Acidobacteria bacterium]|nr:M1 family metallopeptidase [Acidobacteriota bacterium]
MLSKLWATALLPLAVTAAATSPKLLLDDSVTPVHYTAQLSVTPGSDTFDGAIDIDVSLKQPASTIWLNGVSLTVKSATAAGQAAKAVEGNKGFIGFEVPQAIPAGPARLHIEYSGKISRSSSAGVFQLEDDKQWYVYTQFESIDARRAFPCFDQPSFKTPWDLSLKVPADHKAFANGPEVSSTKQADGSKIVKFATTRPLPAYLVAFAVGPFDVVDLGRAGQRSTPMRIVMPKGHAGEAQFASESLPQLMAELETYFGMPFPYPKLDSVVMPISNFAMENAGLITYGSSLLLSKPKDDSVNRRRACASVAAHEMAHQWFGDLVTTAWWNDIWLNEAFASWMADKIVAKWKPEWQFSVDSTESMLGAMGQDSLASSRKIRQPIESEDDIANAFDGITYEKGSAVINMFEHWIGEERFRNGVRSYVASYADKAATADQFLGSLAGAGARDIAPAFSSFLNQAGTPVVRMELECGSGTPQVKVLQSRFLPVGSKASKDQTWSLPVCVRYQADGKVDTECSLLTSRTGEISLRRAKSCPAWVLGNDREIGYYRVEYSGDLLSRLVRSAAPELSASETVGLLSDARALSSAGLLPPAQALSLVSAFAGRKERQVVGAALEVANLATVRYLSDDDVAMGRKFLLANFGARAEALGWKAKNGEADDVLLLRQDLVPFMAKQAEDQTLIDQATALARVYLKDRSAVAPEMASSVLSVAASHGDPKLFDELLAAAKASKVSQERRRFIGALGAFQDPALVDRAMGLLLTGEFDLREAFFPLLFGPLQHKLTERLPYQFVRNHIDDLIKVLPGEATADYAGALPGVGQAFCDATSRQLVSDFFSERVKNYTGGPRNLAQVLERIGLCMEQKAKLGPEISAFLKANVK